MSRLIDTNDTTSITAIVSYIQHTVIYKTQTLSIHVLIFFSNNKLRIFRAFKIISKFLLIFYFIIKYIYIKSYYRFNYIKVEY